MTSTSISPSRLSRFLACQLQLSLDVRPGHGGHGVSSANLGTAIHVALERLCASGAIRDREHLATACRETWAEVATELFGDEEAAATLPGYHLKVARFPNAASRLADILDGYGEPLLEQSLGTKDGLIAGKADLYARDGDRLLLIDYKSGVERDQETGAALVPDYERQLQLYGYMLHDMFGVWPERAAILPLDGEPIEVDSSATACSAAAADAYRAIETMSSPGYVPVASPSPKACRYCDHLLECPAFELESSTDWAPALLAVTGTVVAEQWSQGSASVSVRVDGGTLGTDQAAIVRISPVLHPAISSAQVGSRISATGLYPVNNTRTVWAVRESGRVCVHSPSCSSPSGC